MRSGGATPSGLARLLAGVLLVLFLSKGRMVTVLLSTPSTVIFVGTLSFMVLVVAGAFGLVDGRSWGFYAVYLLVPLATFIHGIALVPFVTDWIPDPGVETWAIIGVNAAFLVATAVAHRQWRTGRRAAS